MELIRINVEHIKDEASDISNFDVTEYLDEINDIVKVDYLDEIEISIDSVINHNFNQMLKKGYLGAQWA